MREFKNELDWHCIVQLDYRNPTYKGLPLDVIWEFRDYVDWDYISDCYDLTEEFIKKARDKVNWEEIGGWQDLSDDFIREFWDMSYSMTRRFDELDERYIIERNLIEEMPAEKVDIFYSHNVLYNLPRKVSRCELLDLDLKHNE